MARKDDFNRHVLLPPGLTTTAILSAHTFGLRNPASKLKVKAIYQRKDVKLIGGKAAPGNGD
jgi:hypothetical protein